ncbi:hypothetical protein CDL12_18042 [Handroanthus impetiginosus]|uniref:Uncharacterized protein n=1 Tax=Handroanthus impetiginosus TaxID=429701 RepID=A0A2G9GVQ8_9LAMI|nr:hypothetical protein CDL12_18042 [Handroanthus impetiginosus]
MTTWHPLVCFLSSPSVLALYEVLGHSLYNSRLKEKNKASNLVIDDESFLILATSSISYAVLEVISWRRKAQG